MADKEGVTLSLEEEEEDADVALAYKTPEKKSLQEIQELDPGDESLRKYKQALLGAIPTAVGKAGAAVGFGHGGAPAAPPGDAASAGSAASGVLEQGASRGASPAGRAHPGWNRPWVLPVPPTRAETPAFPADSAGARGPQLPWLRDHRRSFHRNGYREPGNSWG